MKTLTLSQLKTWNPCNGHDWLGEFKEKYGKSAPMFKVEKELIERKEYSAISWMIGKRLEKLTKRQCCMFSYRCANRALKHARKKDLKVLKHAISFAKQYADTGKVDEGAARSAWSSTSVASAAWSATSVASAARSAWSVASAATSAASATSVEYEWQLRQLNEIEDV